MEAPLSLSPMLDADRRRLLQAGLLLPLAPMAPLALAAPRLRMVNTVYPPFVNEPGSELGEGLDVEIAHEALRRAGYAMDLELVPWRRVLMMLETGQADFTTTISRRDDRNRYLDWSPAYRLGANYRFYGRRDEQRELRALADLKDCALGVVAGFHYPPPILDVPGVRQVPGRDVGMLVQMLLARRSDYIVATATAGAWEIRTRGLDAMLQRQPYEYFSDSPNYLAFARQRAPAMAALPAVARAVESMLRDGTLKQLEKKYSV